MMIFLNDIAKIVMGQSPESSSYNEVGKGLPFYQGKAEFGANYPVPVKWCSKPGKITEKGDVLISVRAPVGPTNICQEMSCIGRGLAAVRPLGGMQTPYLRYWLSIRQRELEAKATGTTFQAISGETLRSLEIKLPPLPEQKRIVAKIESLFSRLDSAKDSLVRVRAEIKRYRQAVLKWAFEGKLIPGINFRKVSFAEVIKKDVGGGTPSKNNPLYWQGNIPWASVKDMKADKYLLSTIDNINQKAVDNSSTNVIPAGNVIVCTRISVGKILINKIVVAINQDLRAFFLKDGISISYFFYYYGTVKFKTSGTTVKGIRKDDLLQYPFPLCSHGEQIKIVQAIESRFERAKVLEDAVAHGLSQIERLKQSILKKAFEDKLVEPDPNDEPIEVLLERIKKEKAKLDAGVKPKRKNYEEKQKTA